MTAKPPHAARHARAQHARTLLRSSLLARNWKEQRVCFENAAAREFAQLRFGGDACAAAADGDSKKKKK